MWLTFSKPNKIDGVLDATLILIHMQLSAKPREQWPQLATQLTQSTGLSVDILSRKEIEGSDILQKLSRGETAYMQAGGNETWLLRQLNPDTVLALKHFDSPIKRGALEWFLALLFYATIALAVMLWLWPLTHDLRQLERATASFGDRNWVFRSNIKSRSQIFPLAETFRKMAARIDGLIGSHKDLSNAVAHEIKTPLARMQFEVEAAVRANDIESVRSHLNHIKSDIAGLNALVSATMDYAILERADMALNIAAHDLTKIVPAVVDAARREARDAIAIQCNLSPNATDVRCDAHLMITAIKNLLYNAVRYARTTVRVTVQVSAMEYVLTIDDDGPGIMEDDKQRIFKSFVQLEPRTTAHKGFGLGLAIVKRIAEWHEGNATITASSLGGASFSIHWPRVLCRRNGA